MNETGNQASNCAVSVPTDWETKYREFKIALRKMDPPSEVKAPGVRLGFVLYQIWKHGEDSKWGAELPVAFKAFHTRLARAKIRAVT